MPTKTNPLGVKGAGEAGNVGALPAVANALVDALYSRAEGARIESDVTFEDGRKGVLKAELKIRDAQAAAPVAPLRRAS